MSGRSVSVVHELAVDVAKRRASGCVRSSCRSLVIHDFNPESTLVRLASSMTTFMGRTWTWTLRGEEEGNKITLNTGTGDPKTEKKEYSINNWEG